MDTAPADMWWCRLQVARLWHVSNSNFVLCISDYSHHVFKWIWPGQSEVVCGLHVAQGHLDILPKVSEWSMEPQMAPADTLLWPHSSFRPRCVFLCPQSRRTHVTWCSHRCGFSLLSFHLYTGSNLFVISLWRLMVRTAQWCFDVLSPWNSVLVIRWMSQCRLSGRCV